jgi:DNA modification methylase
MLNATYPGDCRALMQVMALTSGARAQTCVTSPPYFGLRDYGHAGQIGLEPTPEAYVAQLVEVFRCVRDVLADDGTLWLNLGDSYGPGKQLMGVPWRVAFALQSDGWILRSDIIWSKPNPMPESVIDRPTKAHEYLFLFANQPKYYYDADAIAVPSDPKRVGKIETRFSTSDKISTLRGDTGRAVVRKATANRRSVWEIVPSHFKGAHFATFPPDLVRPCILAGSRPGDTVLDPFMGSGTVAQVAKENGRNYIGCELNPEYIKLHAMRGL